LGSHHGSRQKQGHTCNNTREATIGKPSHLSHLRKNALPSNPPSPLTSPALRPTPLSAMIPLPSPEWTDATRLRLASLLSSARKNDAIQRTPSPNSDSSNLRIAGSADKPTSGPASESSLSDTLSDALTDTPRKPAVPGAGADHIPVVPTSPEHPDEVLRVDFGTVQSTPMERFLGCAFFAVVMHVPLLGLFIMFAGLAIIFMPMVPMAAKAPVMLAAALYIPFLSNGFEHSPDGFPIASFKNCSLWRHYFATVPLKVISQLRAHESSEPPPPYICVAHPHSAMAMARMVHTAGLEEAVGVAPVRSLAARGVFFVPLLREMSLASGSIDASREVAQAVLRKGQTIAVVPGGVREMYESRKPGVRVVLARRRGFVRLALGAGATLVPVVVFNEREMYRLPRVVPECVEDFMRRVWFPMPLIVGRWGTWFPGVIHRKGGLGIVIGKGIEVKASDDDADVEKVHRRYVQALIGLFEEYKEEFGHSPDDRIEIV